MYPADVKQKCMAKKIAFLSNFVFEKRHNFLSLPFMEDFNEHYNCILFLLLADVPLAAGHYLENSSALKIKVEIAQPLVTVNQIAANEPIPTSSQVKDLCQDLFMAHYVFR